MTRPGAELLPPEALAIARLAHELMEELGTGPTMFAGTAARSFSLTAPAREAFVRLCLHDVLAHGGLPLRLIGGPGAWGWAVEDRYGTDPDDIVDGVIADWKAAGAPTGRWGEWWFGPRELVAGTAPDRGST